MTHRSGVTGRMKNPRAGEGNDGHVQCSSLTVVTVQVATVPSSCGHHPTVGDQAQIMLCEGDHTLNGHVLFFVSTP